jgi:hypothetical protein
VTVNIEEIYMKGFGSLVVMRMPRVAVAVLATVVFAGCGGGGGGGGGSDASNGVRVLHAAIDASPVDLVSSQSSSSVVTQQHFAGDNGYRSVGSGPQVLSLTRTQNAGDVLASFDTNVDSSRGYSILLYGDLQSFGLRSRLIENNVPSSTSGAFVKIVNGVTRAAALSVTVAGASSEPVEFGGDSEYVAIPTGDVRVVARRSADGAVVAAATVSATEGGAYTVLFAGEVGYYAKGVVFTDR